MEVRNKDSATQSPKVKPPSSRSAVRKARVVKPPSPVAKLLNALHAPRADVSSCVSAFAALSSDVRAGIVRMAR